MSRSRAPTLRSACTRSRRLRVAGSGIRSLLTSNRTLIWTSCPLARWPRVSWRRWGRDPRQFTLTIPTYKERLIWNP
ncbi:unnamed protein product [Pieris brassicae]|uniref:Uncharacterized protein n=1 Tax=Pieris brassicae TaxID=7116 RepID=A0A9P0XF37_PIEBR|nr:unnamed protein product [Pieris brassicae]